MDARATASAFPFRTSAGGSIGATRFDGNALARMLLKLVFAIAVLAVVAGYADVGRAFGSLTFAPTLPLLAAALLLLPNLGLQHAKWRLLARGISPGLGRRDIARSLFIGFAMGLVTPARAGELAGRAYGLPGTDTAAIAGLTAVDKLASMFVTLLAGLAGCALYAHRLGMWSDPLLAGVALAGVLLALGVAVAVLSRNRAAAHPARRTRFGVAWARAREAARAIPFRTLVALLVLSVAFYLVFIAQFVLLLQATGGGATLGICAGAATVMLLKTVIPPLTFGELGIREGVAVFVFAPLGFRAGAAFDASLLLFALNVLLPAIAGACVLIVFHGRRRALP